LTWSPEGKKKKRGRPEIKWEREMERVMKPKPSNLPPEDSVNRPIRRKAAEDLLTGVTPETDTDRKTRLLEMRHSGT
jgi:hypothetical protein